MPPVALRLRAVFPPFRHALHPRHTYYLRCLSTRLDLAYFRGHARTSVFGPRAMANPLFSAQAQGRTALPPVAARLLPVAPGRSVRLRPDLHSRHGASSPAARRLPPPSRHAALPPAPSPKTYIFASVSFHALALSLFPRPCPNPGFRPARHGERLVFSPDARPNRHAARRRAPPCPSLRSSRASVLFSLRSSVPFTKDIHIMFGVFPHAWT